MAKAAVETETIPPLREQPPQLVGPAKSRSKLRRFGRWLISPDSTALIYLGLAISMSGFGLLAFTWSKVAGTLSVGLQLPYIASGGFVGVGLVVVGAVTANIAVKRRDNFARIRELQKLSSTMESIENAIADPSSRPDGDER